MFFRRIASHTENFLTGAEPRAEQKQTPARQKRARRGATAMEYLVVASFILVVVISAVQYFGSKTNQLMDKSANATSNLGP